MDLHAIVLNVTHFWGDSPNNHSHCSTLFKLLSLKSPLMLLLFE